MPSPTLEDWLELLELKPHVDGVRAGTVKVSELRSAIEDAREHYPNISQDYIAILDAAGEVADQFQEVLDQQAEQMVDFERALRDTDEDFDYREGYLLTPEEVQEIERIMDALEREAERQTSDLESIQSEIEDYIGDMEQYAADAETGQLDAESDLEDARSRLEAAIQAYLDAVARLRGDGT